MMKHRALFKIGLIGGCLIMATAASAKISVPFSKLDRSGDQRISLEELQAVFGEQAVWLMAQRDADGDGSLALDELKAHRLATTAKWARVDREPSGRRQVAPDQIPVAAVVPETAPPSEIFESQYVWPVEAPSDDNFIQMPEPTGMPWNNDPRGGVTAPSEDDMDYPFTDNGW